jgi:hypothetical protein
MNSNSPTVKHITRTCPQPNCDSRAFVQVLVLPDKKLQPKVDRRANRKLIAALEKAHKEGLHD